jgi:hypothetical protein
LAFEDERRIGPVSASDKEVEISPLFIDRGDEPTRKSVQTAIAVAGQRKANNTRLGGCLYVFGDRDVFTNISLTRESNARFVARFFADLVPDGRSVVFLDRLDRWVIDEKDMRDKDSASPVKPLQASHMLPVMLQAGVALVALFIALGSAFGPLRDPAVSEHKAFIEHVEAIGRQYARTGILGLTHSARSLARLVVMRQSDRLRGGSVGGWNAVAHDLANKYELEEKSVRAALRLGIDQANELGAPGPDDPSPASDEMLRTLNRLLSSRSDEQLRRS